MFKIRGTCLGKLSPPRRGRAGLFRFAHSLKRRRLLWFPNHLPEPVRACSALRVVLVGAESSGKTTLARALAEHYQTRWVPEYWRFYWDGKQTAKTEPIWSSAEFVHIAEMQNQLEDHYARHAKHILFCDTDAFATAIWHYRYLHFYSETLDRLWRGRRRDLVLFCAADIPFVQDGVRDGEAIRHQMSDWIRGRLTLASIPYVELGGSHDQRMKLALQHIEPLFNRDASY